MNNNVIWSSNGTRDYITGLDDETKFNTLVDRGYDPEMLGDNNLDDIIANDDYMWQDDSEEFERDVVPMLNAQTKNGILIMCGDGECKAVNAEDLMGGDIDPNIDNVQIIDDGDGLIWVGDGPDRHVEYELRAIPEDIDLNQLMPEFGDEIFDVNDLREYGDLDAIAQNLPRIVANESLNEEKIKEAKVDDADKLESEINEIEPLANDYGYEFFSSMPFSNYDNDEQSVEYQYPEFAKVVKAFFKEMGIIDKENIDNMDELDDNWSMIDQHDWDTLMKLCDWMIKKPEGNHNVGNIYKNGVKSPLNDKEILDSREEQELRALEYGDDDIQEESLDNIEEDTITKFPKHHNMRIKNESNDDVMERVRQRMMNEEPIEEGIGDKLNSFKDKLDNFLFDDNDLRQEISDVEKDLKGTEFDQDVQLGKFALHPFIAEDIDEELDPKEELRAELDDRFGRAAISYRKYAGLDDEDEITEELSDYAANRVCYEYNLSKDELKGALRK